MDDITQRSHDLITRLERKFIIKQSKSTSHSHNRPTIRDNEFNFPRIGRHITIVN